MISYTGELWQRYRRSEQLLSGPQDWFQAGIIVAALFFYVGLKGSLAEDLAASDRSLSFVPLAQVEIFDEEGTGGRLARVIDGDGETLFVTDDSGAVWVVDLKEVVIRPQR